MTIIQAKPIIANKFWIVEEDGSKVATLRKNEENKFILSNEQGVKVFNNKESVTQQFGKGFFAKIIKEADNSLPNEVHGYSCSSERGRSRSRCTAVGGPACSCLRVRCLCSTEKCIPRV